MEFYEDGDYIVSTWHPEHNYQGWVDTMHGGILSTLIDEVCGCHCRLLENEEGRKVFCVVGAVTILWIWKVLEFKKVERCLVM